MQWTALEARDETESYPTPLRDEEGPSIRPGNCREMARLRGWDGAETRQVPNSIVLLNY